jgi:CBS domain-containing protein
VSGNPNQAGADSLTTATIAHLRRYPPFDEMDAGALHFLASRLTLAYYPKGTVILAPEQGEPANLFIVQRGIVQLQPALTDQLPGRAGTTLRPGECFSVGALLEKRATASIYSAAADTFCYLLPAAHFQELVQFSPRFQAFAQDYLATLLRESRRLLKMHFSSTITEQQTMNRTLRSLLRRPPVTCALDTPIRDALRMMHEAKIGSIVIATPQGEPLGIFTRHDVVDRVVLAQVDIGQPIATVMTGAPHVLSGDASVYDAALAMTHHGIRHLPVLEGNRLIGVVAERDLFALQRLSMREIRRSIESGTTLKELAGAGRDVRQLARHMLQQGAATEQLTEIISTLNDALTRRIIKLELERHGIQDLNWCWLAFGSEGRYEQTIATDQDNGIIFADDGGQPLQARREALLPFAQSVNRALGACGFTLCKGDIMAGNPRWCLSLEEWRGKFAGWIANTDPQALLNAAIFFDFRPLYGSDDLAEALRSTLTSLTEKNPRFLRQLAQQALETPPPLGLVRDFVVEDDESPPHTIDLKKSGARLFVDAARVIALATATPHTSTVHRLRTGGARLNMRGDEISSSVEAFFFIQTLRLRNQLAEDEKSRASNRVNPDALNEVDRRILKESFRQARKLQSRLKLDYQL